MTTEPCLDRCPPQLVIGEALKVAGLILLLPVWFLLNWIAGRMV